MVGSFFVGRKVGKSDCEKINCDYDNDENILLDEEIGSTGEYTFDLFDPNMPKELENDKDLSKNIEIYDIFFNSKNTTGKSGNAYIYGKNNNDTWVKVSVDIEYYDSEGYRIDSRGNISTIVKANSEFVLDTYVNNDSTGYVKTKLLYSASKVESYNTEVNSNDLEVSDALLNDRNIEVLIKNNSKDVLKSANLGCIYYNDDKVVFATSVAASDINPGDTTKSTFYNSYLRLGKEYNSPIMDFDDYKIFIYSAYNYDDENY